MHLLNLPDILWSCPHGLNTNPRRLEVMRTRNSTLAKGSEGGTSELTPFEQTFKCVGLVLISGLLLLKQR